MTHYSEDNDNCKAIAFPERPASPILSDDYDSENDRFSVDNLTLFAFAVKVNLYSQYLDYSEKCESIKTKTERS